MLINGERVECVGMIVYHGTDSISAKNILENGIDLRRGNKSVDNGAGFYTTPNLTFAMQRARTAAVRVSGFHTDEAVEPVVLEIELDMDAAASLRVREFKNCTYEWREFVFYNRLGWRFLRKWKIGSENHNLDKKYDLVIDETADAGVNDLISDSRYRKDISDWKPVIEQIGKSSRPDWDKQISLHTPQAVRRCIVSVKAVHHEALN